MKKRFVGAPNPGPDGEDIGHEVLVRGQRVGLVKAGEVIDIPDELCAEVLDEDGKTVLDPAPVWSEQWEDVKASTKSKGEGE